MEADLAPDTLGTPCPAPKPGPSNKPTLTVLYLFSSTDQCSDLRTILSQYADYMNMPFHLHEANLSLLTHHSAQDAEWNLTWTDLAQGKFDFLLIEPPRATFSRARHHRPGPRPLRSANYPYGFPWLRGPNRDRVDEANLLIQQAVLACAEQARAKRFYLLIHPEQLGCVGGEQPASIWDWDEVQGLQQHTGAHTLAFLQCQFGAPTCRPTRFLTNAVLPTPFPYDLYQGWHVLSERGAYLGPLPTCACSSRPPLIGKLPDNTWQTSTSSTHPPGMCAMIAQLIISAAHPPASSTTKGGTDAGGGSAAATLGGQESDEGEEFSSASSCASMATAPLPIAGEAAITQSNKSSPLFHGYLIQAAVDNQGLPMTCG